LSNGEVYVIELNLRASRSMPFTSKVVGYNLMMVAVEASLKGSIGSTSHTGKFNLLLPNWFGVKSPQFSWTRLRGAYPLLGPEMRSVGEAAAFGNSFEEALLLSWLSVSGNRIPSGDDSVLIYNPTNLRLRELGEAAKVFSNIGYRVLTVDGMDVENADMLPKQKAVEHIVNGKVGLVITAGYAPEKDYVIRRLSADLMIPLILDQRLALEISKAIAKVNLSKAHIREMKEFWISKEKIVIPVGKPFNKHPTSNTLGYAARS
jgi:carbamoyl-phosphate synthase large subunit